jgi:hypothetical protein
VEGAAAAGGGEEAEERAGARAPPEHRAGLMVLLQFAEEEESWRLGLPGGVLMRFGRPAHQPAQCACSVSNYRLFNLILASNLITRFIQKIMQIQSNLNHS